jgi:hypothetical protein
VSCLRSRHERLYCRAVVPLPVQPWAEPPEGDQISLKYLVRSDGSIGVRAAGTLASESDVKELGEVSRKLAGCGAKLVHLDLAGPCAVDGRIVASIV